MGRPKPYIPKAGLKKVDMVKEERSWRKLGNK